MEEMRTRILPRMLNDEVEAYLTRGDVIIVPVGTVELHGGLPLDSETVISEAFALRMAEAAAFEFTNRGDFAHTSTPEPQPLDAERLRSACGKASTIWEPLREAFFARALSARFTSAFTARLT